MSTLTVYLSGGSGWTRCSAPSYTKTFSDVCRNTNSTTLGAATDYSAPIYNQVTATPEGYDGFWLNCFRGVMEFDTSALTSVATISAATLWYSVTSHQNDFGGSPTVRVVGCSPANSASLTGNDWSTFNSTQLCTGDMPFPAANNTLYSIDLNATGIAYINKTGYTPLGLRNVIDINLSEPTWVASGVSGNTFSNKGNAVPPYLVVTYSTTNQKTIQGVNRASVKTINGIASASLKTVNGVA